MQICFGGGLLLLTFYYMDLFNFFFADGINYDKCNDTTSDNHIFFETAKQIRYIE
jgi:hypothetical protein